jgi:acetoacetate decarboxylase
LSAFSGINPSVLVISVSRSCQLDQQNGLLMFTVHFGEVVEITNQPRASPISTETWLPAVAFPMFLSDMQAMAGKRNIVGIPSKISNDLNV